MAKFKVTFNDQTEEEVEADTYVDVDKTWIDFLEPDDDDAWDGPRTRVRLAAKTVARIDRLS